MTIVERLQQIENDLPIYNSAIEDSSTSPTDRQVISFKLMYEMIAFSELSVYAKEFKPKESTQILVTKALRDTAKLVNIVDNKIQVSSTFNDLLKQREAFLKAKTDGKLA